MLKAKDIMNTNVITVKGSATVAEAMALMKDRGVRALMVERIDRDGEADSVLRAWGWCPEEDNGAGEDAYGIITESDIVYRVIAQGKDPAVTSVCEVMTQPCIIVNPDLAVENVARLFANNHVHQAPVIHDQLMGMISVVELMRGTS